MDFDLKGGINDIHQNIPRSEIMNLRKIKTYDSKRDTIRQFSFKWVFAITFIFDVFITVFIFSTNGINFDFEFYFIYNVAETNKSLHRRNVLQLKFSLLIVFSNVFF